MPEGCQSTADADAELARQLVTVTVGFRCVAVDRTVAPDDGNGSGPVHPLSAPSVGSTIHTSHLRSDDCSP